MVFIASLEIAAVLRCEASKGGDREMRASTQDDRRSNAFFTECGKQDVPPRQAIHAYQEPAICLPSRADRLLSDYLLKSF